MPSRRHKAPPHLVEGRAERPRIGLALGAGGARGLAHIPMLEVLDEFHIRPARIAGTSMGAILGAAYAAGVSGRELRQHVMDMVKDKPRLMSRLLQARVGKIADLFSSFNNPVLVDGEKLLDLFWPEAVPDRFEDLPIPFQAVATDFGGRCSTVFSSGALVTGVAASMAIPGLIKPVQASSRIYIDGGTTNPLPFDLAAEDCDLVIAVDVTGGPPEGKPPPEAMDAIFGATQIMQGAITALMLQSHRPDILVRPEVAEFRALDFLKVSTILRAAEPAKEQFRRDLAEALAYSVSAVPQKSS
jgi:NTE family protein